MTIDPRVVWMPGGVRTEIHLSSEDTAGAFCLLVDHPPTGWSLPPHLHRGVAETIHVLDGDFEFDVDGEASRLLAGQSLHVPADAVHSGAGAGRRILIFSPGGMERFFLEAGAPSEDARPDLQLAFESARRHGWEFV